MSALEWPLLELCCIVCHNANAPLLCSTEENTGYFLTHSIQHACMFYQRSTSFKVTIFSKQKILVFCYSRHITHVASIGMEKSPEIRLETQSSPSEALFF